LVLLSQSALRSASEILPAPKKKVQPSVSRKEVTDLCNVD